MNRFKVRIKTWWFICVSLLLVLYTSMAIAAVVATEQHLERPEGLKSDERVIKILAIGNSFSEDAIEHYLFGLASAGGHRVIIGNLYIGGAPLSLHWKNANENIAAYEYRKVDVSGKKTRFPATSIEKALADEDWDFISFQQSSPNSGRLETYVDPLPKLLNYVKGKVRNPKAKYVFHQTWAYAKTSPQPAFSNYDKDQLKMYNSIMAASKKAVKMADFSFVVPAGTAIQNARTSFIGDNLCRDGYHLDLNIGRYTASCVWYESIFDKSVIGNTFRPEKVTEREAAAAQAAAHKAIKRPYKITVLKAFAE